MNDNELCTSKINDNDGGPAFPTPETAAASFLVSQGDPGEWAVPLEVAENIERALGEAREKYFAMRDLHTNATELAEKYKRQRDEARELAEAYKEYAQLLGDEINDMVTLAHVHGWQSPRIEQGKVLREKIKQLEAAK